jgi:hypothetical protein
VRISRSKRCFGESARWFGVQGDFVCLESGMLSVNEVRLCGFVGTLESILELFEKMARLGILPPMKVDDARPLV